MTAHRHPPALASHEIHIWTADLRAGGDSAVLEASEVARSRAFARDVDRRRFVAARSALRVLVSRYVGRAPRGLRFGVGPWGKPELSDARLRFNVSHSEDVAVLAFTLDDEIGVDIEHTREFLNGDVGLAHLAGVVCAPDERTLVDSLHGAERRAAFYRMWTRKEAFVKALGRGLSQDPREVAVSFLEADTGALVSAPGQAARDWTVQSFPTPPGYAGAYAVRRRGGNPCRQFDFDAPPCSSEPAAIARPGRLAARGER